MAGRATDEAQVLYIPVNPRSKGIECRSPNGWAHPGRAHPSLKLESLSSNFQKKEKNFFQPQVVKAKIQPVVVHQGQMKLVWVLKIGIIKIFFCHIPIFPCT